MQKRSSKVQKDLNRLAASVVAEVTGASGGAVTVAKNKAAVELGRLGGLKGGKARAQRLNANERRAIAIKAARARWKIGQSE